MPPAETVPEGAWVAVQVRCNAERNVAVGLGHRCYQVFLPQYTTRRKSAFAWVAVEAPLFPGYLFCRWARSNSFRIVQVPGVVRILGVGRTPLPIDENEVAALQRIAGSKVSRAPWSCMQPGNRVTVVRGPLQGLQGTIECIKNRQLLIVRISVMRRAVAVHISIEDTLLVSMPNSGHAVDRSLNGTGLTQV
jgi:transcriptional antiterminator NusG